MSENVRVSGFTIVRNANRLAYPFPESALSILPICDELIICCGDSTDGTNEICEELTRQSTKIKVVPSVWDAEAQKDGYQLKHQTNKALSLCQGNWCFYIQSDELIHDDDLPKIKKAITEADHHADVDGILFNYLHFYGNFNYTIRGRNWYRREVRAFKNGRNIESFRDAQGFRKNGKKITAIDSNARVFHYGYVRSPQLMQEKAVQMSRWWGGQASSDPRSFELVRHIGLQKYDGTHPSLLKERISASAFDFDPKKCRFKWDKDEIKNALTLVWESIFPFRLGEFRNYEIKRCTIKQTKACPKDRTQHDNITHS
ncbi:MAG: glycosyltransferase family 2 protein [Deltaproteobacteria bacterium]|nr:glycosyltransferase family 2 protein [Deltaproteobacteria bacterium]